MVPFQKKNIFALLVLLASVELSANGVGFWCDTDKYDCDRHSSGIAEKNAVSVPSPATGSGSGVGGAPGPGSSPGTDSSPGSGSGSGTGSGSAPGPAPTPFLENSDETVDTPEVIDKPDGEGWKPIDPPEIVDASGKDGAPTSAPRSEDGRQFPVLPFIAIAAGGGFLISLFFYMRRRQGAVDESADVAGESAVEVDQPDVTA